jgi:hypothetical protein
MAAESLEVTAILAEEHPDREERLCRAESATAECGQATKARVATARCRANASAREPCLLRDADN